MNNYPTYKLGQICIIERGGSPRPIKNYLTNADDGINWIKIGDATLSNKYIYKTAEKIKPEGLSKTRKVESGDLILSNSMSFGHPYIMRTSGCIHDGWVVFRLNKEIIDEEYLYTILTSNEVYAQFSRLATGSTVKNLNIDRIKEVVIPLPPLPTQHQIVSRIESLFAELDKAEERLRTAQQQLKTYKQAVLKSAFESCVNVQKYLFGELMSDIRNGYSAKPTDSGDYKLLRISSVRAMNLNLCDYRFNNSSFEERDIIRENDLLFTRYNGSVDLVGVCACVPKLSDTYAYPDKIIRCRPKLNDTIHSKYLQYYINQGEARDFVRSKIKTTSGQNGISGSDIKKIEIPLPPLSEQQRIVEEIESRLSQASTSSACIEEALQQTEALRQSILKKAFSGELVVSTSSTTTKGA